MPLYNRFFEIGISESRGWGCLTLAFLVFCLEYQRVQSHPPQNIMDEYAPYICITNKGYSSDLYQKKRRQFSLLTEHADRVSHQSNKPNACTTSVGAQTHQYAQLNSLSFPSKLAPFTHRLEEYLSICAIPASNAENLLNFSHCTIHIQFYFIILNQTLLFYCQCLSH